MLHNKDGERKCFKVFGHFSIALVLLGSTLNAQSFSEFKKQQFESYKKYKDERDAAFEGYLKQQWKAYKKFVSGTLYDKPKPKKIRKTKPKPVKPIGPPVIIKVKKPKILPKDLHVIKPKEVAKPSIPKEKIKQTPVVMKPKEKQQVVKKEVTKPKKKETVVVNKPKPKKPIVEVAKKDIEFDFFGTKVGFDIDKNIKGAKFYPTNQKGIASYFDTMALSNYDNIIQEINNIKKDLNLNDWGIYILVDRLAHKIYKYDDEAKLFKWFVFNKLGYAVKVGISKNHPIVMYYSKKIIYSTPNFRFGKKKYYVIENYNKGNVGAVYTYKKDYPNATKPLDLSLNSLPNFKPDYISKTVTFRHFGKQYKISYMYNKNLIDFFATYPQADYETFFNAPLDPVTYSSIANSLKEYVDGKKASYAMNFVLNFVQNAFAYETDQQQFGREKVMFALETLYYKKSDCEDRAVLYSYLTKNLFNVPVLGVKYSNHMATALYVPLKGDKVKIKNKEFVVADPTYINANIGQAMPQYKGKMPKSFVYVK